MTCTQIDCRFVRSPAQQPADQRHRPLQHPLRLLHAGAGRIPAARELCSASRRSSGSSAIAVPLGIDKIRLTGGEPLVRRGLPELVEKLAAIPGVKDIGLTTNGILLAPVARTLRDAGLSRINISLDTMDPARFEQLTRRTGFEQVIEGILAAKDAGFDPVKVNAVAIKGMTEDDVVPLARFAREHGLELRFIEYMPLDAGHRWEREKVLFAAEILDLLDRGDRPAGARRPIKIPRAGARLRLRRRRRPGRLHRLGQPAVLPELQPDPAHRRRQAPQLPVLARRDRRPCAPPRRSGRGRDRPARSASAWPRSGKATNQHRPVHQARAADALDRRLNESAPEETRPR